MQNAASGGEFTRHDSSQLQAHTWIRKYSAVRDENQSYRTGVVYFSLANHSGGMTRLVPSFIIFS